MINAKKILITTEKREFIVVRRRKLPTPRFCGFCGTEQTMVTLDEATDLTGISTLSLVQQLNSLRIHSYETSAGRLLVCQESLKTISNGVK